MTRLKIEYRIPVLTVIVSSGAIESGNISRDATESNDDKAADAAAVAHSLNTKRRVKPN